MLLAPKTPASVFAERADRLAQRIALGGGLPPCVFPAGWSRPRNFAHSHFPFRAESHFLYLLGQHIEGAIFVLDGHRRTLYLEPPGAEAAIWSGAAPSLDEWSSLLELEVRPIVELDLEDCALLPPQDDTTALWLTALLDRAVEAQTGAGLDGADAQLADAIIMERLKKDDAALSQMVFAAQVSSQAHVLGMQAARQGATVEAQVRAAIESHFAAHGLSNAYNSIVTTHGEVLHAERSDRRISPGDLMLCDVGAESPEGYAADITRTWPVDGKFSPTQKDIYELVLDVQKASISDVQIGVHYASLHKSAVRRMGQGLIELGLLEGSLDSCVESGAVSVFFPHGLGHLLGLDVHDMEDLGDAAGYDSQSRRSGDPIFRYLRLSRELERNMVVTIEPGFYQIPSLIARARKDDRIKEQINWILLDAFQDVRGIRIEDDVVATERGPQVLSHEAPKSVLEIEEVLSGLEACASEL